MLWTFWSWHTPKHLLARRSCCHIGSWFHVFRAHFYTGPRFRLKKIQREFICTQKYLCKEPVLLGHAAASLGFCSRIFEVRKCIKNLGNRLHSDTVSRFREVESWATPLWQHKHFISCGQHHQIIYINFNSEILAFRIFILTVLKPAMVIKTTQSKIPEVFY